MVECRTCGRRLPESSYDVRSGGSRRSNCRDCRNARKRASRARRKRDTPRQYWTYRSAQRARTKSGGKTGITDTDLQRQLMRQDTRCIYCGKLFSFEEEGERKPTLDKVDPLLGYTPDNTVIACARCNRIKSDATWEELEMLSVALRRLVCPSD